MDLKKDQKRKYTSIYSKQHKNIKLENTRPWWNTWILIKKIYHHSWQTSTRNEQMPTRSPRTRINDQRKDHIDPKRPLQSKIDKMQQNSKCSLCSERDETINHIISECSKLAQKENKTWHDCVGKVIHWKLCKKLKFDHTNDWYMHNSTSLLENDTYKLPWDFDIQKDHLITARRPDLITINKKENRQNFGLCCPSWPQSKIEINWKER